MKHRRAHRTLGRTRQHREALLANMSKSLLEHGAIVTTEARAKELRRWFEPLLSRAKGTATLHQRRLLIEQLGSVRWLDELYTAAQAQKKRAGGYLRLTKLPNNRSDGARSVRVELVD